MLLKRSEYRVHSARHYDFRLKLKCPMLSPFLPLVPLISHSHDVESFDVSRLGVSACLVVSQIQGPFSLGDIVIVTVVKVLLHALGGGLFPLIDRRTSGRRWLHGRYRSHRTRMRQGLP